MFREVRKRAQKAGQAPGTATYTGKKTHIKPRITVINYSDHDFHEITDATIDQCLDSSKEPGTIWVNVEGLQDVSIIKEIAQSYQLHPLTVGNILNVDQRSKVEEFDDYLFVVSKLLTWDAKAAVFLVEQFSMIVGKNFVLSFQESATSVFDNIRKRLRNSSMQRLRQHGGDYLAYRLIDAIVDQYFVVLEGMGDQLEKIEDLIISAPTPHNSRTLYRLKRQLLWLRKTIWPMREAISHLLQVESDLITSYTRVYLRDVYDHAMQAMDTLEIFRETLSNLLDMYLSSVTNKMNEIMKTLTIIATIFIPITAIASIYGMNFQYMPELQWRYGYPTVLGVMACVAVFMICYFWRKRWI